MKQFKKDDSAISLLLETWTIKWVLKHLVASTQTIILFSQTVRQNQVEGYMHQGFQTTIFKVFKQLVFFSSRQISICLVLFFNGNPGFCQLMHLRHELFLARFLFTKLALLPLNFQGAFTFWLTTLLAFTLVFLPHQLSVLHISEHTSF